MTERSKWEEFMEHISRPPESEGENADGDYVYEWPRVRCTIHIKPVAPSAPDRPLR